METIRCFRKITMYLPGILASLVSVATLTTLAAADLRITADHHSFGGVNFPSLQFLEPSYRDELIRAVVKSNARVIRLFSKTWRARLLIDICD